MTIICGWCPDAKPKTAAAQARGEVVTHGMCPNCAHRLEALADNKAGMKGFADLTSHGPSSVAPTQRILE